MICTHRAGNRLIAGMKRRGEADHGYRQQSGQRLVWIAQ